MPDLFQTYVIHFSPLEERRKFLESNLDSSLSVEWITESNFVPGIVHYNLNPNVFSVSPARISMDVRNNGRSMTVSRKRALIEGVLLYLLSSIPKFRNFRFSSLPDVSELPAAILELGEMHVSALRKALLEECPWALVLEDDAIPKANWVSRVSQIVESEWPKQPIWINLNSGADLQPTASDKKHDKLDLFQIKPPATRCSTAYLVNKEYISCFIELVNLYGLPAWLPMDYIFQVANRKLRAKSFWAEPEVFTQGSETGHYLSNLSNKRDKKFLN